MVTLSIRERDPQNSGMNDAGSETGDEGPTASTSAAVERGRRRVVFRCLAVLLGLSVVVAVEGLCRLAGWGRPVEHDDPFVGFSDVHPLFLADPESGEYRIAPSRRRFFADESFPLHEGPRTRRVFVLGGSTVQGRPYSTETSFTTFLEIALTEAQPQYDWEVVNCGGISYASYRLLPVLDECLAYEPDLVVVCTGHNEFLEDRSYGHLRKTSGWTQTLLSLRTVVLLRKAMGHGPARRPVLPAETDPILDYREGLSAYHRDEVWRNDVVAHFAFNLRRMAETCRDAHVPLLFVRPPSNLRDTLPFKSELRGDLGDERRHAFHRLLDDARTLYGRDPDEAMRLLEEALMIDDGHADAWYEYGELAETLGRLGEARSAYVEARDHDVCPLRMISALERELANAAVEHDVPLFDAHDWFERQCDDGILDSSQLVDHVHPSIEGHRQLANAMVRWFADLGFVRPDPGWESRAARGQRAHVDALDEIYFLHGQRTLEAVRAWTQGRADGPPVKERFPDGRVPSSD